MRTSKPNKRFTPPTYQATACTKGVLTKTEADILECVAAGRNICETARELDEAYTNVQRWTKELVAKLGAANNAGAVAIAIAAGILKIKAVRK